MLSKTYSKLGLLLVALLSLSLVVAACGDNTTTSQKLGSNLKLGYTSTLAANYPASTALYLSLNTDQNSDQLKGWQNITKYLSNIPELAQLTKNAKIPNLDSLNMSVDFDKDVKPWLGKELAIGLTDLEALAKLAGSATGGSNANPLALMEIPALISFDVKDKTTAEAFIKKLLEQPNLPIKPTTETYKDFTIYNLNVIVLQLSAAVSANRMYIAAGPKLVKAAIDQDVATSLSGKADYKAVSGNLPASNLGFVYADTAAAGKAIAAIPAPKDSQQPTMKLTVPEYMGSLGMSFATTDDGMRVDSYQSYNESKLTADQKQIFGKAATASKILSVLPDKTFFFSNGQDGKSAYTQAIKSLEQLPADQAKKLKEQISQFEQNSGLSLENDIASLFAGEFALFATPEASQDMPLAIGLVTAVSDKAAAQTSLDKIAAGIEKSNGAKFQVQTFKGVTYKSATIQDKAKSFVVNLGIAGNYAFVSSSQAQTEALITAITGGANFSSSPTYTDFNKLKGNLPTDNQGYFYLDIQQAFGVARNVKSDDKSKTDATAALDKITQLKSVASASKTSTKEATSTVYINFPVTK